MSALTILIKRFTGCLGQWNKAKRKEGRKEGKGRDKGNRGMGVRE